MVVASMAYNSVGILSVQQHGLQLKRLNPKQFGLVLLSL
jgi:hypothetical protein